MHTIIANHKLSLIIYAVKCFLLEMNSCSLSVTNGTTYFNFEGPHTNNHVEGWHSRLKKVLGKPHPIDVFKREEGMKMQMLETGAQQAPRRRWPRQKKRWIQNVFARFNSGAMRNIWMDGIYTAQDFVIRLYIKYHVCCTFNIVCHSLCWFNFKTYELISRKF